MFGYIQPKECELKVREQRVYKSVYCGLCKSLKRHYGLSASLCLQYDCSFLALLLGSLGEENHGTESCKCLHHFNEPKRRQRKECPSLHFAAAVNVILAYCRCQDSISDGERLKGRAGSLLWQSAYKQACEDFPLLKEQGEVYLLLQQQVEKRQGDIDAAAHPTGSFLKALASLYPGIEEKERLPLGWLLYHLGRWVYCMDAWEDREEDEKQERFNPFTGKTKEDAAFCLYHALEECEAALQLLPMKRDRGLVENIIQLGCREKTQACLSGRRGLDESV